jgi:hypothetical protein
MDIAAIRQHRRRLFTLLPRIFAQQPEGTAIASVIDAMATALAELDDGFNRTQRDHWLALARGDTDNSDAISALEKLGHLLGIARLKDEATADYRQRIPLTAKILTRGLTTPRSLLELAIVTLGAEPCPQQLIDKDAIIAFGVPLGTVKKCPNCTDSSNPCPNIKEPVLEAVLTENPPYANLKTYSVKPNQHFTINSPSLTEDVPEIRLKAVDKNNPIQYPILQNSATGEIMLFAGEIKFGEELSIWPQVSNDEDSQFDSHDNITAHVWRKQYPSGSAVLIDSSGKSRSVNNQIYYLIVAKSMFSDEKNDPNNAENEPRFANDEAQEGVRFANALTSGDVFPSENVADDAINVPRFASPDASDNGAKFAGSGQIVRSPRIRASNDEWLYGIYTQDIIGDIAGEASGNLYDNAPKENNNASASLSLSWWIRPPATFHLRIPRNDWVIRAEQRGASQLFAQCLQQAKAAGVKATLDYPEPPLRELLDINESLAIKTTQHWQDALQLDDKPPLWQIENKTQEQHDLGEGALIWQGVFDQTRFDTSRSV